MSNLRSVLYCNETLSLGAFLDEPDPPTFVDKDSWHIVFDQQLSYTGSLLDLFVEDTAKSKSAPQTPEPGCKKVAAESQTPPVAVMQAGWTPSPSKFCRKRKRFPFQEPLDFAHADKKPAVVDATQACW